MSDTQLLKLWDFMFASCFEAENGDPSDMLDKDSPSNIFSVFITGTKHISIDVFDLV